mmetsp:Transcript_9285/g.18045  ORF Transcript_9285/g.18045 Transcript_9285/m.18045 type:complete len:96 (+) Transcript_9285:715-1002(+)
MHPCEVTEASEVVKNEIDESTVQFNVPLLGRALPLSFCCFAWSTVSLGGTGLGLGLDRFLVNVEKLLQMIEAFFCRPSEKDGIVMGVEGSVLGGS